MSAWTALGEGLRRVGRAPVFIAGVWTLTLLVSVPLAVVMRGMLAQHLGGSLAADSAATGVNYDWMQEFGEQASGVGVTFRSTVIGFVAGGIIDRLARDRPIRAHGFFSACGVFFFRFLRLAAAQWIVYAFLFGATHAWLFDRLYPRMIHEVSAERTAFVARAALYLVFGVLVAACSIIFDYAKVRAVVEDRRSMLGAINAAIGFISRNYAAAVTLFLLDVLLFAAVVGAYAVIAPGAGGTGATMWIGFLIGQLYVVARLAVKLAFWASAAALFQSRLAHAGYVTRPVPVWPESPVADMM